MAKVKLIDGEHCVTHSTTGQVLTRGGERACYTTRAAAQADAAETKCRVLGICPKGK